MTTFCRRSFQHVQYLPGRHHLWWNCLRKSHLLDYSPFHEQVYQVFQVSLGHEIACMQEVSKMGRNCTGMFYTEGNAVIDVPHCNIVKQIILLGLYHATVSWSRYLFYWCHHGTSSECLDDHPGSIRWTPMILLRLSSVPDTFMVSRRLCLHISLTKENVLFLPGSASTWFTEALWG